MDSQLPIGAHLVTPRRGYLHHGIYLGEGRVVHYAGYSRLGRRGPVEIVTLARFASGSDFWVVWDRSVRFNGEAVVRRALERVGEDGYSVIRNNCEHFCAWCITGVARSEQVERVMDAPRRIVAAIAAWFVSSIAECSRGAGERGDGYSARALRSDLIPEG